MNQDLEKKESKKTTENIPLFGSIFEKKAEHVSGKIYVALGPAHDDNFHSNTIKKTENGFMFLGGPGTTEKSEIKLLTGGVLSVDEVIEAAKNGTFPMPKSGEAFYREVAEKEKNSQSK